MSTLAGVVTPSPLQRRLLEGIAAAERGMVERVRAWAEINSGSAHRAGLDRMRAHAAEAFDELGGEMTELPLPSGVVTEADGSERAVEYAPALRIRKRPEAPLRVALTGHYDTVFGPESGFQSVIELGGDRLGGPGVADMKGGLVVLREALLTLERSPYAGALGWTVLLSPDEEIGSPGSRAALAELGAWADVGMTYEPCLPDGALVGARKGSAALDIVVRGRAAHAGRDPELGRNAIGAAAWLAAALDALDGFRPGVTVNVARIDGGGPVNVIPGLAVCRVGIRITDATDWTALELELERLIAAARARDGISVELHGGVVRAPKPLAAPNQRLLAFARAAGAALGLELALRDSGGVSEGNNLWAAGCPNVDTLGVRGDGLHSCAEYLLISSLVERAQLSALMLMQLASGAFDARRTRGRIPC